MDLTCYQYRGKPKYGTGYILNPYHPLDQSLAGLWLFNERAGSKINSVTGLYPATNTSGVWVADGIQTTASSSQYFKTDALSGTALHEFTIIHRFQWFNPGAVTVGIWQWANALSSGTPFMILQYDGGGSGKIRIFADGGYRDATVTPVSGTVYEYAITLTTGNLWTFYLNGSYLNSYSDDSTHANQANAANWYWGNGYNGYSSQIFLHSSLHLRALSAAEILSSYWNRFGTPSSPRLISRNQSGRVFVPSTGPAPSFKPYWIPRNNRIIGGGLGVS